MKPEELHAIASELGMQFDEDSRVVFMARSQAIYFSCKKLT